VNGTLKVELAQRTIYPTREKAREDIARWIELRYNRACLHSGLGYRTPQEVMDEHLNGQEAAWNSRKFPVRKTRGSSGTAALTRLRLM
jgi:hypothetical protein